MDTTTDSKAAADEQASASVSPWRARLAVLSFGNIGAIYVWAALIVSSIYILRIPRQHKKD